jgi:predicted nucleotidyltransferase
VQRELAALVQAGLLQREQSGRQVYFQANPQSPIFPELQGLILKTAGLAGVLRAALAPVEPRVAAAVVFGSMASGRMHGESDIDLLVVSGDLSLRDLAGPIRRASDRLGREVNINLYRPDEWAERAQSGHPLARSILSGPRLNLIGGADELERLAEKRLGPAPRPQRRRDTAPARRGGARPPRGG